LAQVLLLAGHVRGGWVQRTGRSSAGARRRGL